MWSVFSVVWRVAKLPILFLGDIPVSDVGFVSINSFILKLSNGTELFKEHNRTRNVYKKATHQGTRLVPLEEKTTAIGILYLAWKRVIWANTMAPISMKVLAKPVG